MKSRVTERGQVTIPKKLRERLGIRPGQVLDFSEEGGRLVAVKSDVRDPVDRVYGAVTLGGTTDELMAALRGDSDAV